MSYTIPTVDEIRTQILTAWRNLDPTISTSKYSDEWIRAHANACALRGTYGYVNWTAKQAFPDTADPYNLERHAGYHGLTKTLATTSQSSGVKLTGLTGTAVAAGLEMVHTDGTEFETTSGGTISGGQLIVSAVSITTGSVANKETLEELTLTEPPDDIDATATITVDFFGGEEAESDASLLNRLLQKLQKPPAGGKTSDYETWALQVDGVTEVYTYPLRRGLGTIDLVALTNSETRLPTDDLVEAVQIKIDQERPITAYNTMIVKPDPVPVEVLATVWLKGGYEWVDVQAAVQAAIASLFTTLEPGATLYRSAIETAISNVAGVEDRTLTNPAGKVMSVVDATQIELIIAGNIDLVEGV